MKKKTLLTLALTGASGAALYAQERPNIVLFMVDDMGWQDTSVPFWTEPTTQNSRFETPNMERLAAMGVKFTQAYACSISSPSRCSLITGANNARHRVSNWTLEKDKSTDRPSTVVDLPDWNLNGVSPVEGTPRTFVGQSFVELLRRSGYHTIHCGKAHWGAIGTPGEDPLNWGFDVNIAGHAGGGIATYLSEFNYGHNPDGTPFSLQAVPGLEEYWGSGVFATEALTRKALEALACSGERPFFLYMSHYAVHVPIDRDMRFYPKYLQKGLSPKEAAYASLVEGMDKSLGDLMDWLEENGKMDSTILLFMSDNGGLAAEPDWRDGPVHTQNSPLRSGKGSLHEGGIREPMIVCWSGMAAPGTECGSYVMIEDFYPSILEMAGVECPASVDGKSFVPLLRGTDDPSRGRALYWNFPNIWGNDGPGINLNCAIRLDEWKLIYHYDTGIHELYRIPDDIGEQHDLAGEYPEIVRELSSRLGGFLRSVGADRPVFRASGTPCPWPDIP